MQSDKSQKEVLFDFFKNIKDDSNCLSYEQLAVAIEAAELARSRIKDRERENIRTRPYRERNARVVDSVLYIPKGTKIIKSNAYKGRRDITRVVIPDGVTEIGEKAFCDCVNLREVVFPNNRVILKRGCFMNCIALLEVYLPNVSNICPNAFYNCVSLEKVFLPSCISNIYTAAFKNCRSLSQVTFEEGSIYCIGVKLFKRVFENCSALTTLTLPHGWFDKDTFIGCSGLREIYVNYEWRCKIKLTGCGAKIIYKKRGRDGKWFDWLLP